MESKKFVQTDTEKLSRSEADFKDFLSKTSDIHGDEGRIMLALPKWRGEQGDPCIECLVRPSCKERCEKLQTWNIKMHKIVLIECWVNLGIQFFDNMTKIDVNGVDKSTGMPFIFLIMMRQLLRVLGYLINCQSWRDKKLYEFDRLELNSRLKNTRL